MTPIKHTEGFYTIGPVATGGHVDFEGKALVGSGTVTLAFATNDADSTLTPADVLEAVRMHLAGTAAEAPLRVAIAVLRGLNQPKGEEPAPKNKGGRPRKETPDKEGDE